VLVSVFIVFSLNIFYDLFRIGIVSDPSCRCGAALENSQHFFLDCPIYLQNKIKMDSDDVHVHPIQFQLYQLYDKASF
jgi:hypothetical protein